MFLFSDLCSYDVPRAYTETEGTRIKKRIFEILSKWVKEGDFRSQATEEDKKYLRNFAEARPNEGTTILECLKNVPRSSQ